MLTPGAHAQQVAPEVSATPHQVRAWLTRIHEAATTRNFQGTFVVSGGGTVASARISHFCEGTQQFERIESLDGQARHVLRHNDIVQTVWPGKRVALVEQRDMLTSFPALFQAGDDRITEFYDVFKQEADRVAGHEAHVLWVKPKDPHRYGYRLWADKASGLLLRADVLGERSEVLETSAFSDVVIGVKPQPELVLQAMRKLDGYRVVRPVLTATSLEAEGWSLREGVPGFRQVSCVKRPLDGGAAGKEPGVTPVLQAIYSDGLTHVSVFIEPFNPTRHTRPLHALVGATQTLMQRHGDWWVTVVGDVPPGTLRLFAGALERRK
ncbi:MAG: sigma E regulatory protein, MucB/RseB [Methylibium sp. NZG]|nr:MAG: sigma E regulatory protein, MucB/RseB [Methylibium sp. NZG]